MLGALISGGVIGAAGLIGDWFNRGEMRRQEGISQEMANRQFLWGQKLDRFQMGMAERQQDEAEKMNKHQIRQNHIDRLNEALKMNVGLQNHVRQIWGGK